MHTVLTCITQAHDHRLITLAAFVCTLGVYATFAVGEHASRSRGRERRLWAATSIIAAGCTAWATHFIALLAFRPGMQAGFEPILTALSLLTAIIVIGAGVALAVSRRGEINHFIAGSIIGCGVGALHYIGQSAPTTTYAAGGQAVPVRVLRSEVPIGHKTQTVFAIRDQRERLRTEAQMRALAFNDALTGLPNRARFHDVLTEQIASCRSRDQTFAVLVIDLDRFKPINDMFGHAAGDLLLRKVADRLSSTMREDDVVARLGGDEFAVLQTDADTDRSAADLAERCVAVLSRPFTIDGHVVQIGASVGVALGPRDGKEPAELLHKADLALYAAKADGKGTFRLFEAELEARIKERRLLETGLRRAIACGEFELHYQPLLQTSSGSVTSAEALIRWRDPARGLIPPSDFISVAEETGLIIPIGEWVLYTACAEAATWPEEIGVAVNLSPVQFRDSRLVQTVTSALVAARLSPSRLELEITEGVLLMDEQRTLDTLLSLRGVGVGIVMDDFGTGYSSLSYLRRFPFNKIKVDQSFIRQLPADQESAAIVRAIITMGACLGISTTVEGVETAEQFAFTAAEGCDHVQGYLVSRPLPATDFAAFVGSKERRDVDLTAAVLEPT